MNKKNKTEKEKICNALDAAFEKVEIEQDVYRARMDVITDLSDDEVIAKLQKLGGEGIAEIMKNECYPPTWQNREKHLQQTWEEIPSKLKIDRIQDKDIGFKTHMLNEIVEHTARIRAGTVFCEAIGTKKGNKCAGLIFHFWVEHSVLTQLAEEQKYVDEETSLSLRQYAESIKSLLNVFAVNAKVF